MCFLERISFANVFDFVVLSCCFSSSHFQLHFFVKMYDRRETLLENSSLQAETREAVAMLTKAVRLLRRFVDDDDLRLLNSSMGLKEAHEALARFEEPGVLSARPCWWRPSSPEEDEAEMARVFVALVRGTGSSSRNLSSEAMEQGLRMRGLFNFTASSPDPVDMAAFVAIACNALQKMKVDAIFGSKHLEKRGVWTSRW